LIRPVELLEATETAVGYIAWSWASMLHYDNEADGMISRARQGFDR
jgi:hypothetical protein